MTSQTNYNELPEFACLRFLTNFIFFPVFFLQLITREEFEDALKELQDEGMIVAMGKTTIRIC